MAETGTITLYFIRHGETDANKKGVFQGHLDVPLSNLGQKQADRVALALKQVRFDAVYSSDLLRAKNTAEAIMKFQKCRLMLDRRLREVHLGIFQGNTQEQNEALYPEEMALFRGDPINYLRPGGESLKQLQIRAGRAMDDIVIWNLVPKEDIVLAIVSHGGTIMALFRQMGFSHSTRVVRNCSISIFKKSSGGWTAEKVDDVSHLEGLDSVRSVQLF